MSDNYDLGETVKHTKPDTEEEVEVTVQGKDSQGDVLVNDGNNSFWLDPSTLENQGN